MSHAVGTARRGRLSVATLLIASAAATAAALITSRLWAHGAILGTAITPLIVAIVSELLHRPADQISRLRAAGQQPSTADTVLPGSRETDQPLNPPDTPIANARRRRQGPPPPSARRHVNLKAALATSVAAFAIAAGALTLPELIFGGAVATNQETTLFGGHSEKEIKAPPVIRTHTAPTTTQATRPSATPTTRSTATKASRTPTTPSATTPSTVTTTTSPPTTATTPPANITPATTTTPAEIP